MRHSRTLPRMRIVNSLNEARAALASGENHLYSPSFAACHAGVNYYRHLVDALGCEFPDVNFTFTLCCGADAAIAHDALRLGFRSIQCDCDEPIFDELTQIAAARDASIMRSSNALDPAQ